MGTCRAFHDKRCTKCPDDGAKASAIDHFGILVPKAIQSAQEKAKAAMPDKMHIEWISTSLYADLERYLCLMLNYYSKIAIAVCYNLLFPGSWRIFLIL